MKVGIVVHPHRAVPLARAAIERIEAGGHEVRMPAADAAFLDRDGVPDERFGDGLDLAVALGGDGTMLRAVGLVADDGVPVLGVNLGELGYLTEVEPEGMEEALDRCLLGDHRIEERMRVAVEVERHGERPVRHLALNEAVVEKAEMGHTVRVEVDLDGRVFTTYVADGVIVASPTGSTAYAFSARGPIIDPSHRALLLTPVSPHMLFDRSLVLSPETTVRLTVLGERGASVAVDGRGCGPLAPGESVRVTVAAAPALLVTFGGRDFHDVLSRKFRLPAR